MVSYLFLRFGALCGGFESLFCKVIFLMREKYVKIGKNTILRGNTKIIRGNRGFALVGRGGLAGPENLA